MGYLKDIANQPKIQSFPSTTFEISGEVPASQCSEAQIEGTDGYGFAASTGYYSDGSFTGFNLIGKVLHIVTPPVEAGNFLISANDNNVVHTAPLLRVTTFTDSEFFITDGAELIITRNIESFANFISAAGYAYTIKGNKLYTNIPSNLLQPACTILFDPLT